MESRRHRRLGRARAPLAAAMLAVLLALGAAGILGAFAAPSAHADGLTPLTLEQPTAGEVFSSDSAGVFRVGFAGLGAFGDLVTVAGPGTEPLCEATVHDDGTWSCEATSLPDFFGDVVVSDSVTTIQRMLGAVNPPRLDPDQAAGISTDDPAVALAGTAAPGALVAVLRDGSPACSAVADAAGRWSCALTLTDADAGSSALTATQTPPYATAASASSPPISLTFHPPEVVIPVVPMNPGDPGDPGGPAEPTDPGAPVSPWHPAAPAETGAAGGAMPATPPQGAGVASAPPAEPSASDSPAIDGAEPSVSVPAPSDADPGSAARPNAQSPAGSAGREPGIRSPGVASSGRSPDATEARSRSAAADTEAASRTEPDTSAIGGWNDPTRFGTSLRSPAAIPFGSPAFAVSVLLVAAGFLFLLVLPAELLQSTIRENHDRIAPRLSRLARVTGLSTAWEWARNGLARRIRPVRAGARGPLLVLVATAAISAFADPSTGLDARSLRLMLALALVMLVVNGVAVLTGGILAARLHAATTAVSARPLSMLLVVATVLVSRAADLQPGILFGLVLGVEFGIRMRRRQAARIAIVTACALLILGLASWLAFGLLEPVLRAHPGFGAQLASEVLTGVTVEAISGLVIALLPLAFLDGSVVFSASKRAWALLYAFALGVFAVVILPVPASWVEVPSLLSPWAIGSGVFAVVSIATWAGFRFTRPRGGSAGSPEPAQARRLSR